MSEKPLQPPWRIAVDIGGTFTDVALCDDRGQRRACKVPSRPATPDEAVVEALQRLAQLCDVGLEQLLSACSLHLHGSTLATNTLLEGKGARVGLLTTEGARDSLEIRRGIRNDQWDHRTPFAPVLVPRYLRRPVRGRLAADGSELESLSRSDVIEAARVFREEGVEAVAICLLHSCIDPHHERTAEALLIEALGDDIPICLSSDVRPIVGEYLRTSTAVVNAALLPIVAPYLSDLEEHLAELGLEHSPLLMQSSGGCLPLAAARERPVQLLLSGPAAGASGLRRLRRTHGDDLLLIEVGGTSCDVTLMSNGDIAAEESLSVAGYRVATPAVDIHTVGAGGGAIARLDEGLLLQVGPQGAGAMPGPACYGRGGVEPTVTDAQLVLGRLPTGTFAAGELELDAARAFEAIDQKVATPLGLSVEDAAATIVRLVEQHLVQAAEACSTERGIDPQRLTLVAAGGAGALFAVEVARALGCRRVVVPGQAGVFCADGMLAADVELALTRPFIGRLPDALDGLGEALTTLEKEALRELEEVGFGETGHVELRPHLRYLAQTESLAIPTSLPLEPDGLRADFEQLHQRLYGHTQPGGILEITSLSARAIGRLPASALTKEVAGGDQEVAAAPVRSTRRVWIADRNEYFDTPILEASDLRPGTRLCGPLVVEAEHTTLVLGSQDTGTIDEAGDFVVDVAGRASGRDTRQDASHDSVLLALTQNRLDFISRQMGFVMTRTARSPIFSQAHDFTCFLTDAQGQLTSAADGIPIHSGGGGLAVRALLDAFGSDLSEDDVFVLNDPYAAGGNHLPDWVVARPVFVEGQLLAFACNRAHQSDIGGGAAGTYNPEATEIYHEGLRLPPLRLYDRGEVRSDVWQLLLLNSRTPELLDGDLRAMVGSIQIGAQLLVRLAGELGPERARQAFEAVLDHGERRARAAIGSLPDGTYRARELTYGDCFDDDLEIPICVALKVSGDRMRIDFTDTGEQIKGFKNSSLANSTSAVLMALVSFFDKDLPRNEGALRAVDLVLPEGTIVNPRHPAPVTMCTVFIAHEIVQALWKALASADPERGCAGWGKSITGVTTGPGEHEPFVLYHWHALPGAGAVDGRDGFNQLGHLITLGGLTLPDIETFEHLYPLRIRRQELRCDGGGAGQWRGGTGVDYEVELAVATTHSFRGEGLTHGGGFGLSGGASGKTGTMTIHDGEEVLDAPRYGILATPSVIIRASSPGGGGFGDPKTRDPKLVLRDVRDGIVSERLAREEYGVVIRDAAVDARSTEQLRAAE